MLTTDRKGCIVIYMNGNTNPENKMRRAIIAHHGCCDARGGARCKARKNSKGRKGKGVK